MTVKAPFRKFGRTLTPPPPPPPPHIIVDGGGGVQTMVNILFLFHIKQWDSEEEIFVACCDELFFMPYLSARTLRENSESTG